MDRDLTDLQFMGIYGISKESLKIIFSFKKIFFQITLSLILPLTFVYPAPILFSYLLFGSLDTNSNNNNNSTWALYFLFRACYLILVVVLALLSTSAVVYTVACIYTSKPITFKTIMSVVPKIWKRPLVTFFWTFIILFVYHVAGLIVQVLIAVLFVNTIAGVVCPWIFAVLYVIGLIYICVIWELACVVSVLEELYGIKAIKKSKMLIRGKMFAAAFIFVWLHIFLIGVILLFEEIVVDGGRNLGMGYRVMIGIRRFVLCILVILYALIVQTVIYFVCKSYHNEEINKSSLSEHLEGYVGYVKLNGSGDVQLGEVNV